MASHSLHTAFVRMKKKDEKKRKFDILGLKCILSIGPNRQRTKRRRFTNKIQQALYQYSNHVHLGKSKQMYLICFHAPQKKI